MADFIAICLYFQLFKEDCNHPSAMLKLIVIREWKWEVISMEFIIGLLRTSRQHDSIMVVVDLLIKVVHFIPVKSTYSTIDVAEVFIIDVVRFHGVIKNIVSKRDTKFTYRFWKELFVALGIEFSFSTTYHLLTDGETERVAMILGDMLRMCVMHQQ